MSVQKLEILNQLKTRFSIAINPDLSSIKYCQTSTNAYLEIILHSNPTNTRITDLYFISDDFDSETVENIPLLFNPNADIVDNAVAFVGLDLYTLAMCFDNLFTKEKEKQVLKNQQL